MADLHQFPLSQLIEVIADNDAFLADNYLSDNLAVARNMRVELIHEQIMSGPVLLPEMRLMIVLRGWARPVFNLMEYQLNAGDLVYLGTNGILEYLDVAPDIRAIGISMSDELFSLAIGNKMPRAFDGHLRDFIIKLKPHQLDFLNRLHGLIYNQMCQDSRNAQVVLHIISSFLWYVDSLWDEQEQTNRAAQSRAQQMFSAFMQLVTSHASHWHTIEPYASQLCVTPRYLSTVVKQVSGKSAKQWIDEALVTRIKIDLRHSDKSVAQISDELTFPNPSFFTRFFKRMTGMTPSQLRR